MGYKMYNGKGRFGGKGQPRIVVFLLIITIALSVAAQSGLVGRHSFSIAGPSVGDGCLVCHVKGGGLKEISDDIINPSLNYRSRDGRIHELDGVSKLCISCHDSAASDRTVLPMKPPETRLKKDHPVGVVYPPRAANGRLRPRFRRLDSRVKLFGPEKNQVSCATCHDPHENGRHAMLREPVGSRELCLQCHNLGQ